MARRGTRYECPRCGDSNPFGTQCPHCEVPLLDENGLVPPPSEEIVMESGPHIVEPLVTLPVFGDTSWLVGRSPGNAFVFFFGYALRAWRWVLRRARAIVLRKAQCNEMKTVSSVVHIARATDGVVRVRGRVQVLQPVTAPNGMGACAAFFWRTRTKQRCTCSPWCVSTTTVLTTRRACGRFVVFDSSGAALVDDDFFELDTRGSTLTATDETGGIVLYDGDEVEVIGPAARQSPLARGVVIQSTFREAPSLLVFDGRPSFMLKLIV